MFSVIPFYRVLLSHVSFWARFISTGPIRAAGTAVGGAGTFWHAARREELPRGYDEHGQPRWVGDPALDRPGRHGGGAVKRPSHSPQRSFSRGGLVSARGALNSQNRRCPASRAVPSAAMPNCVRCCVPAGVGEGGAAIRPPCKMIVPPLIPTPFARTTSNLCIQVTERVVPVEVLGVRNLAVREARGEAAG